MKNSKQKKKFNTTAFAQTAMLSALTIVLSFLEGMLPELPVPGAKLGLANLAVMTATDLNGLGGGLCTTLIKAFFAVITRGSVAGFMSLCGSLLSMLVMWFFMNYDRKKLGYVGIGVLGAVSHNLGQLIAAFAIIGGSVFFYLPFLIIVAVFTGTFTGIVNSLLLPAVKKVKV